MTEEKIDVCSCLFNLTDDKLTKEEEAGLTVSKSPVNMPRGYNKNDKLKEQTGWTWSCTTRQSISQC